MGPKPTPTYGRVWLEEKDESEAGEISMTQSFTLGPVFLFYSFLLYHLVFHGDFGAPYYSVTWIFAYVTALFPISILIWSSWVGRNVKLQRKSTIGCWDDISESSIPDVFQEDVTELQAWLKRTRAESGVAVTMTHVAVKLVAKWMSVTPRNYLNGYLCLGHWFAHKSIDICVMVRHPTTSLLIPHKVVAADTKSVVEIAKELIHRVDGVKKNKDGDTNARVGLMRFMPQVLVNPMLKVLGLLSNQLALDLSFIGAPKFPFGSVMVTNVGSFELGASDSELHQRTLNNIVFPPIMPWSGLTTLMCVGRVVDRPWVVGNKVEVRPVVTICVQLDHRLTDATTGLWFQHIGSYAITHPETLDDPKGGLPTVSNFARHLRKTTQPDNGEPQAIPLTRFSVGADSV